jgi:Trypsin-like peptidase domain
MKRLTAQEINKLVELLYPALDWGQLERFVYLGTGERLYDRYVGQGLSKYDTIDKLIEKLETGPITDKFLRVVYREKPLQTELRTCIVEYYPDIAANENQEAVKFEFQKAGIETDPKSEGPALERNVKPALKKLDTEIWLSRFETIKRQVCRVEAEGAGIGTGFLVGPGAVVTNWHVVREARKRDVLAKLGCRFDYRRLVGGGVDAGTLIAATTVVDERPCSDAELTAQPDDPPPKPDQLDYALLRLATPVPERGFLRLSNPPPSAKDDPLIIVQHPEGDPLRFAIDTSAIIGSVHDGLRLRYRTNTAAGSSGSPCFSMDWDLLALHHLGDPATGPATYNQGVPVGLIRKSMEAKGEAKALLGA